MCRRGRNIYKRKDERWEGRYKKGRKESGKLYYGYVYAYTFTEVCEKQLAKQEEYASLLLMKGTCAIPTSQWIEKWLADISQTVKASTYVSYGNKLRTYVVPVIGEVPLNQLEPSHMQELINTWQAKGLKASMIGMVFKLFARCLQASVDQKCLVQNPCANITLPKKEKSKVRALTAKEQKTLEKAVKDEPTQYGLLILLGLLVGLRIGEIAALRWTDIDFDEGVIYVRHSYQRIALPTAHQATQLIYSTPKTEASVREVPMVSELIAALKKHRKSADTDSIYVFSVKGKPCEPRLITYHFQQIREKAGLAHIHFHQLRHTFATRCLEAGGAVHSVSKMLGHTSTQMTFDKYTTSFREEQVKTIRALEKLIS